MSPPQGPGASLEGPRVRPGSRSGAPGQPRPVIGRSGAMGAAPQLVRRRHLSSGPQQGRGASEGRAGGGWVVSGAMPSCSGCRHGRVLLADVPTDASSARPGRSGPDTTLQEPAALNTAGHEGTPGQPFSPQSFP